mgnify:CR=1 FL=1
MRCYRCVSQQGTSQAANARVRNTWVSSSFLALRLLP